MKGLETSAKISYTFICISRPQINSMRVKFTGIVQYMLDLRTQDLKENSSTSFEIKTSVTKTLLLCVK